MNANDPQAFGGSQINGGFPDDNDNEYKNGSNDNGPNVESGTASVNRGDNHEWGMMPLTIKQIENAPLPDKDQSLEIDGREVSHVCCIFAVCDQSSLLYPLLFSLLFC